MNCISYRIHTKKFGTCKRKYQLLSLCYNEKMYLFQPFGIITLTTERNSFVNRIKQEILLSNRGLYE